MYQGLILCYGCNLVELAMCSPCVFFGFFDRPLYLPSYEGDELGGGGVSQTLSKVLR